MRLERSGTAEQPDHRRPPTGVERGNDLYPPQVRARRATRVRGGERQRPDTAAALLVGLRPPQPNMGAVEPIDRDIPTSQGNEFAAPERAGEPHQQQR